MFYCAKHQLHGFCGYTYCPVCAGVDPRLLAAMKATQVAERRAEREVTLAAALEARAAALEKQTTHDRVFREAERLLQLRIANAQLRARPGLVG